MRSIDWLVFNITRLFKLVSFFCHTTMFSPKAVIIRIFFRFSRLVFVIIIIYTFRLFIHYVLFTYVRCLRFIRSKWISVYFNIFLLFPESKLRRRCRKKKIVKMVEDGKNENQKQNRKKTHNQVTLRGIF